MAAFASFAARCFAAARASFYRSRGQSGASVETLRGNTSLTELNLKDNSIGDAGVKALGRWQQAVDGAVAAIPKPKNEL